MKLRFAVDQGACLRRGINCNSSTITIEVDPAKLPQEDRNLIADRMLRGKIDVYYVTCGPDAEWQLSGCDGEDASELICADSPDYAGLIEAVSRNEEEAKQQQQQLREQLNRKGALSDASSDANDHSHWQTYPPWVVFDAQTKAEWVTPETLRYYVAHTETKKWFICDRFEDSVVHGTEAESRIKAIRLFYEIKKRKIPDGWSISAGYDGAQYDGLG